MKSFLIKNQNKNVELQLLYRGSRDGFKAEAFHNQCDNKKYQIILIKNNYGRRFGGCTTKSWDSDCMHVEDKHAFLFSLDLKLQYPIKPQFTPFAIYAHPNHGPAFGYSSDLNINLDNEIQYSNSKLSSYQFQSNDPYQMTSNQQFILVEIEAYQVLILQ